MDLPAEGGDFVICVLTFRRGIVGELMAFFNRPRQPRQRHERARKHAGLRPALSYKTYAYSSSRILALRVRPIRLESVSIRKG